MIGQRELVDHDHVAIDHPLAERALQRQLQDFLVDLLGEAPRHRPEGHAAARPDRIAPAARARPTVALLAERLGAAAAHFGAGLGLGGTGTHAGEESDHGVMNRLFALFEFPHRIRQFVTVDAVALAIKYIQNFRHLLHPFLTACLTMTMPPFGPGIAPRTSSTFSSAITRTTFRFCTVRRTLPM